MPKSNQFKDLKSSNNFQNFKTNAPIPFEKTRNKILKFKHRNAHSKFQLVIEPEVEPISNGNFARRLNLLLSLMSIWPPKCFGDFVNFRKAPPFLNQFEAEYLENGKSWKFTFVMQHGGLSVDNRYPKFHEILIKNQKVLGPYRVNMNGFLQTGSTGTGSWQRLIPMALLISTRI